MIEKDINERIKALEEKVEIIEDKIVPKQEIKILINKIDELQTQQSTNNNILKDISKKVDNQEYIINILEKDVKNKIIYNKFLNTPLGIMFSITVIFGLMFVVLMLLSVSNDNISIFIQDNFLSVALVNVTLSLTSVIGAKFIKKEVSK